MSFQNDLPSLFDMMRCDMDSIFEACRRLDPEFICKHRTDVDEGGRTLLMYTLRHGNLLMYRRLLHGGVSPNAVDQGGNTVLHHLVTRIIPLDEWDHMIRVWIQCGGNREIRNHNGKTAYDLLPRDSEKRNLLLSCLPPSATLPSLECLTAEGWDMKEFRRLLFKEGLSPRVQYQGKTLQQFVIKEYEDNVKKKPPMKHFYSLLREFGK